MKNSKVTGVASLDTLVATLSRDPKFSAALAAAGFTVKKEATKVKESKNPRVVEHLAAAAAARDAYKAVKAKYKGAKGYFEAAQIAQMAALEEFYA